MSAHLTLEELTAHVNGTAVDAGRLAHLAGCPVCAAEARRWSAVREGTQSLVSAAQPPPPDALLSGTPSRRRRPVGRRVLLTSVAAAALTGVAGYAVSLPGDGGTPGTRTVLAAALTDTECPELKVASGTLRSVRGDGLVLRTARGTDVTVTTSTSTRITREVPGTARDVVRGAHVAVGGTGADGAVRAERVVLMGHAVRVPAPPRGAGLGLGRMMASRGTAMGRVIEVGEGRFTVESMGDRVQVLVPPSVTVIRQVTAPVGRLEPGRFTVVVGTPRGDSTLAGVSVQQSDPPAPLPRDLPLPTPELPKLPGAPSGFSPPAVPRPFQGLGCDADAIATTALHSTRA
ncbi:MAG TPA: hypothetical protein VHJ17_23320 [Thermomonospora sp.]|nr:hypothetical protein [Thermomonospora sp.]